MKKILFGALMALSSYALSMEQGSVNNKSHTESKSSVVPLPQTESLIIDDALTIKFPLSCNNFDIIKIKRHLKKICAGVPEEKYNAIDNHLIHYLSLFMLKPVFHCVTDYYPYGLITDNEYTPNIITINTLMNGYNSEKSGVLKIARYNKNNDELTLRHYGFPIDFGVRNMFWLNKQFLLVHNDDKHIQLIKVNRDLKLEYIKDIALPKILHGSDTCIIPHETDARKIYALNPSRNEYIVCDLIKRSYQKITAQTPAIEPKSNSIAHIIYHSQLSSLKNTISSQARVTLCRKSCPVSLSIPKTQDYINSKN